MQGTMINSGSIHLWFCTLDKAIDSTLKDRCEKVLSPDEVKRMESFRFEKHQLQFLISHTFLRILLSHYQDCSPTSIEYSINAYGKPSLRSHTGEPGISFNLSHTDGLACCAVVKEGDIGVDIEPIGRLEKGEEIGEQYFSPGEFADMMALKNETDRKERFFQLWTLKEAYIKARGMGLSLPLHLFSFHFPDDKKIDVTFDSALEDSPEGWNFRLLQPTAIHRTAIAYKPASSNQKILLKTFQTFPFCARKEVFFPLLKTT